MLIFNKKRFIQSKFASEEEIEQVVADNHAEIFGPGSIFLPKSLIKTADGAGTIPDGFAIDVTERRWFLVEAETSKHGVWTHIAPQVAKQIVAATQPATRKLLVDLAVKRAQESPEVSELFDDAKIHPMDIRKVLGEIVEKKPIVGMPIDGISEDLENWARTLNVSVRLWLIRKYVDFENPKSVLYQLPDDARPVLSTVTSDITQVAYDVTVSDLIAAGLLTAGQTLTMTYKPKGGSPHSYKAIVSADGEFAVLNKTFSSPSYAGVAAIQDAGSKRKTVNGWTAWKDSKGKTLADLRTNYLKKQSKS